MRSIIALSLLLLSCTNVRAEIVQYGGSADVLPHKAYIHAVSEAVSPVQQTYVKAKDGVYIAAAIRRPKGEGPFPAIVIFHGAPGGRGMEQLVGWSRGDHGGPVWERFLKEGFVVAVADYRGGDLNTMNAPSSSGLVTAIDDGLSVIEHVRALPYVDRARISVYGASLGGNLALYLASKAPALQAVVLGAPAPIWFLGHKLPVEGPRPDFATMALDAEVTRANIAPIQTPILIQVGKNDRLLPLDTVLHDQLVKYGKQVRMEVYEHGYHDFVLGPQGQKRADMPKGEYLMQGALDALERSVQFVKSPR
ncbi:MAG: alpha/beta hydrolase family protein [Steroidobacter sp.]